MKFKILTALLFFVVLYNCTEKIKETYYCPMHPNVISEQKGTCPICSMDLVKKEHSENEHENHLSENKSQDDKKIIITSDKQMELGIKTVKAELRDLNKIIYSSGAVTYDPELYSALQEYKESQKIGVGFSSGAKLKLEQMGLSDSFIRDWSLANKDASQFITGGKGNTSYLNSVVYEQDIPFVKQGMKITATSNSYRGKLFKGSIRYIDRILDEKTRTLNLRIEVEDKEKLLRPQMFVRIEIKSGFGRGLVVPRASVIDTGERQVVYLKLSSQEFIPRLVRLGGDAGEEVEILEGLKEGDEVVESGNFYLDSESRLRFGEK